MLKVAIFMRVRFLLSHRNLAVSGKPVYLSPDRYSSRPEGQTTMTRPLISVIVPAYGAQSTITRCVTSLLAGGLPHDSVEILVEPDDGASYGWLEQAVGQGQVMGHGPVRVARSTLCASGPGPTRNRALRRATGEWITYVDADDHVAPGYLAHLLTTAQRKGAALAQTRITRAGRCVMHVGAEGATLQLEDWAQSGVSLRGLLHRSRCPDFIDQPAQDILHTLEASLRHDQQMQFSKAVYVLTLGQDTVTTQPDFTDRIATAYGSHIRYLKRLYKDAPRLPEAVAFWQAKAELNRRFAQTDDETSYYEFVATLMQDAG
jgi:glycosyltransferase involved in cell wall biosynthesis